MSIDEYWFPINRGIYVGAHDMGKFGSIVASCLQSACFSRRNIHATPKTAQTVGTVGHVVTDLELQSFKCL